MIPVIFWDGFIPMKCQPISDHFLRKAINFDPRKMISPLLDLSIPEGDYNETIGILTCQLHAVTENDEICLAVFNSSTNEWKCLQTAIYSEVTNNQTFFTVNITSFSKLGFMKNTSSLFAGTEGFQVLFEGGNGPLYVIAVVLASLVVAVAMVVVYIRKKQERQAELKEFKGKGNSKERISISLIQI